MITGIDLSENMLALLQERYTPRMSQIRLVRDSYLTWPFGERSYDYLVSAMSIHHLLTDTKRKLYQKIHAALKTGGKYIEGDSVTTVALESQFLAEYHEQAALAEAAKDGYYHIDVPFSIETQRALLLEAGFGSFELRWQLDRTAMWNMAVYVATRL